MKTVKNYIINFNKWIFGETIINKMSETKNETFVKIDNDKISLGFYDYYKQEENGLYSVYVPAFDIYFTATSLEEKRRMSLAVVKAHLKFAMKNNGIKGFIIYLNKLGFKAVNYHVFMANLFRRNKMDKRVLLHSDNMRQPLANMNGATKSAIKEEFQLEFA